MMSCETETIQGAILFCCVILNMYVMESAVYVLQMFCVIQLHFDILLSIVMKATEWKTLLED